jgi:hypothetical protein
MLLRAREVGKPLHLDGQVQLDLIHGHAMLRHGLLVGEQRLEG